MSLSSLRKFHKEVQNRDDARKRKVKCRVIAVAEDVSATGYPLWVYRHECGKVTKLSMLKDGQGGYRAPATHLVCPDGRQALDILWESGWQSYPPKNGF